MTWWTPSRLRGVEILDDPSADPTLALRSLRDVALANRFFGGRRAVVQAVARQLTAWPSGQPLTLLDVGTGLGDIPLGVSRIAASRGIAARTIGLELSSAIAKAAAARCSHAVTGSALALPFANASVDFVTCSQVLHHFDGADADLLLRECTRVARVGVIIGDLRRSWPAIAGLWAASYALGFHPVSRHDGIVSIRRGFTCAELSQLVESATGCRPETRDGLGFRVVASWAPSRSRHATPMRDAVPRASIEG
jgi:ubiquinone/menaquinone biosynthesis C-methylase UbiE